MEEVISIETLDALYELEALGHATGKCDCDRAIQQDHRRRIDLREPVVKEDDLSPRAVFRVCCRDRCLELVRPWSAQR